MVKPTGTSSAWKWGKRQWLHLLASVVGFGMVVGCAVAVIRTQRDPHYLRHGLGRWVVERLGASWQGYLPPEGPQMRWVHRTPSGFVDLGAWRDEVDGATLMNSFMGANDVWLASCVVVSWPRGVWATTHQDIEMTIGVDVFSKNQQGPPDVPDELQRIRQVAIDAIRADGELPYPERANAIVASGLCKWKDWSMIGLAINTATVLGLGMWMWFTPVVVRDVWRWARSRKGGCASCGYDLRGLTGLVCPECGSTIPIPIPTDG